MNIRTNKQGQNQGCDGGFPFLCFNYAKEYGVMLESDYPYLAVQGYCGAYQVITNSKVTKAARTMTGNYKSMKTAVFNFGSISVGIDAGQLQNYHSGIFGKESGSCTTVPNHAVNVIGYGEENGDKFWIVQNSWSTNWGMDGYFKLYSDGKDGKGNCGLLVSGSYVTF